ncbi:type VII secretion integral membrane protein EccD [Kutzneria buriramensis]|uniref:Type VII secretion integral membrane protein EccD n=1 Tax=Kutzneria buriramensis TaxID=1045776 RepID=A0A3E0H2S3_9PSEU|nr:type VII secretion integral membrane protein EccD [Kutzneria buriramensis]REH37091.1 type VII secretion integral membrane protein EccD [Kutzneria buriramensis]
MRPTEAIGVDASLDPITLGGGGSGPADLCRITVHGPDGRADLAIPSAATFGLLVPVLARHVNRGQEEGKDWVLQRLGEPPLNLDATPEQAELHDGDVLYLRAAQAPIPELTYDDLADGVGDAIAARPDRWRPESTRRTLIGLAVLAAAALGVATILAGGPGGLIALYCGVITLALGGGAVAIGHVTGDGPLSYVGGIAACSFAAAAGLIGQQDTVDLLAPQPSGVLLAGVCVVLVAGALAAATRGGVAVYGTAGLLGICAILGSVLRTGTAADTAGAVSIVAVTLFLFATFGARVAARLARLRVPTLPRTTEELQQDIDPAPASMIATRAALADGYLTAVVVGSSALALVDSIVLTTVDGWIAWVLPLVFGLACLLRAKSLLSVWQRGATVWAGALIIATVVLAYTFSLAPTGRIGLLVGLVLVVAALVIGAWRLPETRLLPIWAQVADIAELWTAIALVPLLLVVLDAYHFFRALAG